jgi:hypothetical protein
MKAKSIQGKSTEEINKELEASLVDGFKPTLAIVFMSIDQDWKALSELLEAKGIEIFGATTESSFTENGIEDDGIVILSMDINKSFFKVVLSEFENSEALETSARVGEIGLNTFTNPAFIISGSLHDAPGEILMEGIVKKVGNDVTIIGGMAGDMKTFLGTLFTNGNSCTKGIITLIIDNDKIDLKGVAVSGWKPVGTEKIVTKAEGSWMPTIDNQPAMDVLWKFIGKEIEGNKISESLVSLDTTFPMQFKRDIGNPVMRPTLMYNTETKAVYSGGNVKEGSAFRFSLPPDYEVMDAVIDSSKEIKETELAEADALLIFSCIGRYLSFGPMIDKENEGIAETWGKPMAGFFSMGEFGKVSGGKVPEFHGSTCSWVALKEK